ncbi:hypothetical protein KCU85_g404, partial [Aureobasidium melanogenum]
MLFPKPKPSKLLLRLSRRLTDLGGSILMRFLHILSAFLLKCLSETAAPLTMDAAVKAVPWGPPLPVMAASARASEASTV